MRWGVLLLVAALPGVPAHARTHHTDGWARDRFAAAERMREALNGRPPADRTRHDYQRVINTYRSVYFGAPTSTKADPSVVAVAETLVEMGRRFEDDKILNEAIAQYKFLRKEYPGSKYRCDALFTMGEIYKDDLNDPEQARSVFQEFLHRYPHNRLVEDAQQAIAELERAARNAEKKAEAQTQPKAGKDTAGKGKDAKDSAGNDAGASGEAKANAQPEASGQESAGIHPSRLPRVTGIRHWSTPDYTRVAIDLESEIKFGSQRIAHPDRIFFALRGTKLASTLVGKSFDVDDGFLKKIRVAQFQPGRTRVVLEVDDLSDYEAFLLPNPYRLIIDIHGKDSAHAKALRNDKEQALPSGDLEAPPLAGVKADVANLDTGSAKPGFVKAGPVKADVPKAELKADMKALAGKPVSKQEQIHDELEADTTSHGSVAKLASATPRAGRSENKTGVSGMSEKTQTPVKRVIVEADDDDPAPAEAAKVDAPTGSSHPEGARRAATDSSGSGEEASADSVPGNHIAAKSHLVSSRGRGDPALA